MIVRFVFILTGVFIAQPLFAQSTQDLQAIRSMCGCYEVEFAFAETFSSDTLYQFHENYQASALEWVEMVSDSGNRLQLQHILVFGDDYTMKHWRQDWVYQPLESMRYQEGRTWQFFENDPMSVAGKWEQRVFQVDDGPRYAALGTWIHADGKKYWEATARTPLPRREYTKRSDYDVMDRLNRHEVHAHGWTHEQDNLKIRLDDEKETVVAEEKGRNTYTRVSNAKCQAAADYWQENHSFWSAVRNEWQNYMTAENKKFTLNGKVEGKPLYVHFLDHPVDRVSEIVASFVQE